MKATTRIAATFVAIVLVLGLGGFFALKNYLDKGSSEEHLLALDIDSGTTLGPVLEKLFTANVLTHPRWLYFYARLTHQTAVRAGTYEFSSQDTPRQILHMLTKGQVKLATFTLAEGLNRWQVRDLLAKERWIAKETFDQLCDDKDFLAKHLISGPSCEGYLFPETYTLARGTKPETVLALLFSTFKKNFSAATLQGTGPLVLGEKEFTTLASIVEKETGAPEERPHIACVFYNRLKAKPAWRLETDPTVIYAATLSDPNFDGNIKRSHLRTLENPYNTYKVYGLPPGPIANPGKAALDAVAAPIACSDFFFVSMNNGKHIFCPTLDCHNREVQKWQINYFRKQAN